MAILSVLEKKIESVSVIIPAHEIITTGCKIYVAIVKWLKNNEGICSILASVGIINKSRYRRLKGIPNLPDRKVQSFGCVMVTLESAL